jgi:hypothetical protein
VIHGLRGVECAAACFFMYTNDTRLKDYNNLYCTGDGNVAAIVDLIPGHDETHFEDLQIFMPFAELHMANGEHLLKTYLAIFDMRTRQQLASSGYLEFSYKQW